MTETIEMIEAFDKTGTTEAIDTISLPEQSVPPGRPHTWLYVVFLLCLGCLFLFLIIPKVIHIRGIGQSIRQYESGKTLGEPISESYVFALEQNLTALQQADREQGEPAGTALSITDITGLVRDAFKGRNIPIEVFRISGKEPDESVEFVLRANTASFMNVLAELSGRRDIAPSYIALKPVPGTAAMEVTLRIKRSAGGFTNGSRIRPMSGSPELSNNDPGFLARAFYVPLPPDTGTSPKVSVSPAEPATEIVPPPLPDESRMVYTGLIRDTTGIEWIYFKNRETGGMNKLRKDAVPEDGNHVISDTTESYTIYFDNTIYQIRKE
jgi:hypothetical protein